MHIICTHDALFSTWAEVKRKVNFAKKEKTFFKTLLSLTPVFVLYFVYSPLFYAHQVKKISKASSGT
jgi:hypothetical protein